MAKFPFKLNDYNLLRFLVDNYKKMPFLSTETKKYIRKIEKIIPPNGRNQENKDYFKIIFNPSRKGAIDVLDFWERLIIDSIKYLKWHDGTEFADAKVPNPKTAYDKISEGSLGVYNIKEYFRAFIEFERLLYGAEQFYRDHVYHILKVWLIGQYIISDVINDKFPIVIAEDKEELACSTKFPHSDKNKGTLYKGEEDAIWCIIALTHDLGYPLSKIENINVSLRKMMQYYAKTGLEEFSFAFPQQNQFINDAILKYISSKIVQGKEPNEYETHIQAKFYLKFSRSFELLKHGLISCIVLVKNLIYFLETNFDHNSSTNLGDKEEARQFVIRREILRAIASHTCPEIYHIKPNSFAFILLIADEMQSWGRPTFADMALGSDKHYRVTLEDYKDIDVSFSMEAVRNKELNPTSLLGLFMEKAAFFKKILRVAVDSDDRKFKFKFTIIDELGEKYEFDAEPDSRAIMKIKDTEIKHTELQKLVELHNKDIFALRKNASKYIKTYKLKKR